MANCIRESMGRLLIHKATVLASMPGTMDNRVKARS